MSGSFHIPGLPAANDPGRIQVARAMEHADAPALRSLLEAWPVDTRPPMALHAAQRAIELALPELLSVALDPLFGAQHAGGFERSDTSLSMRVLQMAAQWKRGGGRRPVMPPDPARLAQVPALLGALAVAGAPLENTQASPGEQPLKAAAIEDLVDVATWLLDRGVDPNGQFRRTAGNGGGIHTWPPLAIAASQEMARLLLSRGARAGAPIPDGRYGSLPVFLELRRRTGTPVDLVGLIATWRAAGGQWDEPMESTEFPATTLPALAFGVASHDEREHGPVPGPKYAEIQWPLLANGFDLDTLAPDGAPYREHAHRCGTPPVRQWLMDGKLPPASARPSRATRRL